MNAGVWLYTILSMGISASMTALVLMAVRLVGGKRFPKSTFCILWLVVIFQMLSPVSLTSVFSLDSLIPVRLELAERLTGSLEEKLTSPTPVNQQPADAAGFSESPTNEQTGRKTGVTSASGTETVPPEPRESHHSLNLLLVGWGIGGAAVIGRNIYLYRKQRRNWATATLLPDKAVLQECLNAAGLKRPVPIYVTEQIESPYVSRQMDELMSGLTVNDLVDIATAYAPDTNMSLSELSQTFRKLVSTDQLVFPEVEVEEIKLEFDDYWMFYAGLNDDNLNEVFTQMELR